MLRKQKEGEGFLSVKGFLLGFLISWPNYHFILFFLDAPQAHWGALSMRIYLSCKILGGKLTETWRQRNVTSECWLFLKGCLCFHVDVSGSWAEFSTITSWFYMCDERASLSVIGVLMSFGSFCSPCFTLSSLQSMCLLTFRHFTWLLTRQEMNNNSIESEPVSVLLKDGTVQNPCGTDRRKNWPRTCLTFSAVSHSILVTHKSTGEMVCHAQRGSCSLEALVPYKDEDQAQSLVISLLSNHSASDLYWISNM